MCEEGKGAFKLLYPDEMSIKDKIEKIAKTVYGPSPPSFSDPSEREFLTDKPLVRIHSIIKMILLDQSCAMRV